ncbi:MAG TPA: AAA family ATPase, partial [Planctomycetota bacterium]|nr:AAA family ATPase [Planctomycetota bacterium]
NNIDRNFFFYSSTYEEAYLRLIYGVMESKGILVLTGNSGCGKSFLSKIFIKDMLEQGYKIAFIANPNLEPLELLQQVSYEFGLEYKDKTKAEILRNLKTFFEENQSQDKKNILIIDEAHLIKNEQTLEEIRLLSNLETENHSLLSIILVGANELGNILQKNLSLQERIGLRCTLKAMNCRETGEYIYFRMEKAGCGREIFNAEAIKEIYTESEGIPRKINNICDLALLLGYGDNAIVIDQSLIKKAISDLKGV